MAAAGQGNEEGVRLLVEAGADLEAEDEVGQTAHGCAGCH